MKAHKPPVIQSIANPLNALGPRLCNNHIPQIILSIPMMVPLTVCPQGNESGSGLLQPSVFRIIHEMFHFRADLKIELSEPF